MDTAPAPRQRQPMAGRSPAPPPNAGSMMGSQEGWQERTGDTGGLGTQESWGHGVVPPASYSQLTPTLLFKNLKEWYCFYFFFQSKRQKQLKDFHISAAGPAGLSGHVFQFSSPSRV